MKSNNDEEEYMIGEEMFGRRCGRTGTGRSRQGKPENNGEDGQVFIQVMMHDEKPPCR